MSSQLTYNKDILSLSIKHSILWFIWVFRTTIIIVTASTFVSIVSLYTLQLPNSTTFSIPTRPATVRFVTADGSVIADVGQYGRESISISQLPPYVPLAFVSIEDKRFFQHFGIDLIGTSRAIFKNVSNSSIIQGGSTITQQLAKNFYLSSDQDIGRKVKEAIFAIWLEQNFSKTTILEMYLNRIYFGNGATGIEAAARLYFDRSASRLTVGQAALLAASVKAPSQLNIKKNVDGAQNRARLVLDAMVEQGNLSAEDRATANTNAVTPALRARVASSHLVDWLVAQFEAQFPENKLDLVVETTIDLKLQGFAQSLLETGLPKGVGGSVPLEGALVSLDGTGAIRALIGGADYSRSQFNRATSALRQPGSAFKPFVYAAALEAGYSPESIVSDSPLADVDWSPTNSDGMYLGQITLEEALAQSRNPVAARLIYELTPQRVVEMARRLGITSPLKPNHSLALGTSVVTLDDLTAAYAAFANGGAVVQPFAITRVSKPDGTIVFGYHSDRLLVLDPATVHGMNKMMRAVIKRGTGQKAQLPGWDVAGKTGTSQRNVDALFVGYSAELITGVWVGRDDNSRTGTSGGDLPASLWAQFMAEAHKGLVPVPLP